jgi:hypothetical protein
MSKQSSNVLIKDDTWGWIPAVQRATDKGKATVDVWTYPNEQSIACDNGKAAKGKFETKQIDLKSYDNGVLPLQNVDNNGNLHEVQDMVKLPYLHEVCVVVGSRPLKQNQLFNSTIRFFYFVDDTTGWNSFQYEKATYRWKTVHPNR